MLKKLYKLSQIVLWYHNQCPESSGLRDKQLGPYYANIGRFQETAFPAFWFHRPIKNFWYLQRTNLGQVFYSTK